MVRFSGDRMRRARWTIIAVLAALFLAACAGAPKFQQRDYVRMESLFYAVEQELCRAIAEIEANERTAAALALAGIDPRNQYAKATVGLRLVRLVNADGSVDFVIPVTGGSFATALSGSLRGVKTVDTSVSVYYPFQELECANILNDPPPEIAGGLGLWQWVLNTTVALINVRETPAAYSYQVRFAIYSSAGARPSFGIVTGPFTRLGGSLSVGASNELTHTLSITVRDVSLSTDAGQRGTVPPDIRDELDREESLTILRRIRE